MGKSIWMDRRLGVLNCPIVDKRLEFGLLDGKWQAWVCCPGGCIAACCVHSSLVCVNQCLEVYLPMTKVGARLPPCISTSLYPCDLLLRNVVLFGQLHAYLTQLWESPNLQSEQTLVTCRV